MDRHEFTSVVNQPAEIKILECGYRMTWVVTQSNQLFATGYNANGELGLGQVAIQGYNSFQAIPFNLENNETITRVVCGGYHTFVVVSKYILNLQTHHHR
jgi:alpha-tubulin suppressor-like RCC1 family protein